MKKSGTLVVYLMLVAIMVQLLPMQALAESSNNKDDSGEEEVVNANEIMVEGEIWVEVIDEAEETISLYEEIVSESELELTSIIYEIPNDSRIGLIEEFDEYSLIEFIDESGDEVEWNGYVYNKYIHFTEEDKEKKLEDDSEKNSEEEHENSQEEQELERKEEPNEVEETNERNEENESLIENSEETPSENDEINSSSEEEMEEVKEELNDESEKENEEDTATFSIANVTDQKRYEGIALKNQTAVYKDRSVSSEKLREYDQGQKLIYRSYNDQWYEATVYLNGTPHKGYINKGDVENIVADQTSLVGIGLQGPTNVYKNASTSSEVLRGYSQGHVLRYRTLTSGWYEATVFLNGKAHTGYINSAHVENVTDSQNNLKGVALEGSAKVYSKASQSSEVLRSYSQGHVLIYKTFTSDWYEAVVYIGGKRTTGYIHKSDVQNGEQNQQTLKGIGQKNPTRVHASASRESATLRSYSQGHILIYRTFVSDWYEATVYIDGKRTNGYIHKSDVETSISNQQRVDGIASKSPTPIYASASRNSNKLRTYEQWSPLIYRTFSENWFEATVYLNGKRNTGYLHKDDVSTERTILETKNFSHTLSEALAIQLTLNPPPQTDKYRNDSAYVHGSYLDVYEIGKVTSNGVNIRRTPFIVNGNVETKFDEGAQILIEDEVTGGTFEGSNKWYQIDYRGDTLYVHSSRVDKTNSLIGIANTNVNVRQESNAQSHIFGRLSNGSQVTVTNKGNVWHQIRYNSWRNALRSDAEYYLNPENNDIFQHLKLDSSVEVSGTQLNRVLVGKGVLAGFGNAFVNAAKTHSVNELYLISHALLETGHGTSDLARGIEVGKNSNGNLVLVTNNNRSSLTKIEKTHNMFGIGAHDNDAHRLGAFYAYNKGWFSPEAAIIGGAEFIGKDYIHNNNQQNTLYKMRWNPSNPGVKQYATDMAWATKQVNQIKSMYDLLDDPVFHFEVPNYAK